MPFHKEIDPRIVTLVRVDQGLRNIKKPKSFYAMSPEMIAGARSQRDQLAQELGLSGDETKLARQIAGYRGYLKQIDYPFWMSGNGAQPDFHISGHHGPGSNGREAAPGEIIQVRELTRPPA